MSSPPKSLLFALAVGSLVVMTPPAWAESGSRAPAAQNVVIEGASRIKGALSVSYTFSDPDGDAEGATRFRWLSAPAASGPWMVLSGVLTPNTGLPLSYGGTYVRAEVTPVDARGKAGPSVRSAPKLVQRVTGNPGTDWFHQAKYGVSHQFISNYVNRVAATEDEKWQDGESWDDFVNTFDVEAYADDLGRAGVGFVLLTLGQNSGYLLAPNKTYETIAGLQPGERTPAGRDLPMEIADALATRGIKLMLYPGQCALRGAQGARRLRDHQGLRLLRGRRQRAL